VALAGFAAGRHRSRSQFGKYHGGICDCLFFLTLRKSNPDNRDVANQLSRVASPVFRRSFRKEFPVAVRGEGVYIWDSEGNRYVDFAASAVVNFIGHGVQQISDAMAQQAAKLEFVHTSQFTTETSEQYAAQLLDFAGPAFQGGAVYFTSGGSESIETALKLARQFQIEIGQHQRYQILSRQQSYHGSTLGALSVSGNRRRREMYLPMVREFEHIGVPYCYRCQYDCADGCRNCGRQYAAELERAILAAEGEAAAFILEPVSGATLGAVQPPPDYLRSIAEICKGHDLLLMADEVMTGMGRTGRNFAVDHWGVTPDILVAAKGLSSGYAPLGAVIANAKVIDAIASGSGAFLHGFTYNAHPVSLAAGRAVLQRICSQHLVEAADSGKAGSIAEKLQTALRLLWQCDAVGDVRGIGLLWAVEFVANRETKQAFRAEQAFSSRVAQACSKRGVLIYPMQGSVDGISGDHILIAPPAVITSEQIEWSVEQLRQGINEASGSDSEP
jgi:adenosylmethionine-8-amino-7-oxononanoate aminotransferase